MFDRSLVEVERAAGLSLGSRPECRKKYDSSVARRDVLVVEKESPAVLWVSQVISRQSLK